MDVIGERRILPYAVVTFRKGDRCRRHRLQDVGGAEAANALDELVVLDETSHE